MTHFLRATGHFIKVNLATFALLFLYFHQLYLNRQAVQNRVVSNSASNLLFAVQRMESAQRGFLLTEDVKYYNRYVAAKATYGRVYTNASRFFKNDPDNLSRVKQVNVIANNKISEMEKSMDLITRKKASDAYALVKTNEGLQYMQTIENLVAEIQADRSAKTNGMTLTVGLPENPVSYLIFSNPQ